MNLGRDIHSLTDFKHKTPEFVQQLRATGEPIVLTINGKAELVVQDAISYQKLLDRVDQVEGLAGIERGLSDVEAGRVTPLRKFEQEFRAKRGVSSRSR